MPVNQNLVERLHAIQSTLMAQHAGGRGLPSAVIGNERETFLREYLQKVFPANRRFSTGVITDAVGGLSGQVDIAVEFGFVPSFPMPGTEERLLLAESVALVIEVKSDLVAQWDQVRETVHKVKALKQELEVMMHFGTIPQVIPCIAVGYKGHSTVEGLIERLNSTPEAERPDAALVIESGCFYGGGLQAIGSLGLYALCVVITDILTNIGFVAPSLRAYVQG